VKFFCTCSKYSGRHFVRFYPCERQHAFFDVHERAFAFYGSVFPIVIHDNVSTAVRKILQGTDRQEQEDFAKFEAYSGFEGRFCTPGQGHEKRGV